MSKPGLCVLPVHILLSVIALTDLFTTLFWLRCGRAVEVNPIMASALKLGFPLFIGIKVSTLAAYVVVMEWYRRHRSAICAGLVGKGVVLAYVCVYSISFLWVNYDYLFK